MLDKSQTSAQQQNLVHEKTFLYVGTSTSLDMMRSRTSLDKFVAIKLLYRYIIWCFQNSSQSCKTNTKSWIQHTQMTRNCLKFL